MQDIINFVMEQSVVVKIIIFLCLFVIHSIFAVLLNKYNNIKHGKPTILAWIPVFNIFLLGKLAVHWLLGLLLLIALFLGICITFNISGLESIYNLLPSTYVVPYQIGYGVLLLILCVVVRIKYNEMIRNGLGTDNLSSFINKDYEKKEAAVVSETTTPVANEMISDTFKYNNSLSELPKDHQNDMKNPK